MNAMGSKSYGLGQYVDDPNHIIQPPRGLGTVR